MVRRRRKCPAHRRKRRTAGTTKASYRHGLKDAIAKWFPGQFFSRWPVTAGSKWSPVRIFWLAILMVWSAEQTLQARFEETRDLLRRLRLGGGDEGGLVERRLVAPAERSVQSGVGNGACQPSHQLSLLAAHTCKMPFTNRTVGISTCALLCSHNAKDATPRAAQKSSKRNGATKRPAGPNANVGNATGDKSTTHGQEAEYSIAQNRPGKCAAARLIMRRFQELRGRPVFAGVSEEASAFESTIRSPTQAHASTRLVANKAGPLKPPVPPAVSVPRDRFLGGDPTASYVGGLGP